MAGKRVPSRITSCDPLFALGELCRAREAFFGAPPTEAEAKIYWGGSSHETGKFRRMPNNGVAGVKPGKGWAGDVAVHRTHEVRDGVREPVDDEFRAYATVFDGFLDWFRLLRDGYPGAVLGARVGDVPTYVTGLTFGWRRRARYFTADPAEYLAGVRRNINELDSAYVIAWGDFTRPPGSWAGPKGDEGDV